MLPLRIPGSHSIYLGRSIHTEKLLSFPPPQLMDLLFSYVGADRPHGALLSGYFCKVVICLLVRRTHDVMRYLQNHREYLKKLVDLIGITSIMEVSGSTSSKLSLPS
jgi:hypothetical protein